MATYTKTDGNGNRKKRWRARVRDRGTVWFLGYYETKEQAEEVEARFRGVKGAA